MTETLPDVRCKKVGNVMYLGIDLGTSAVKLCVLGQDGTVLATQSQALTVQHPFSGASEQDCTAWWAATCTALQALPKHLRESTRAIGLSGQMHGAVLLDTHKQPLHPAILWNDARAHAECAHMMAADPGAAELAGVVPMPGFTAPKLLWLARNDPTLHSRIAHVLLPKDYIGFRLHGRLVTDPSDAAGTSWFDQSAREWSDRLCALSKSRRGWLPQVLHGTQMAGTLLPDVAAELGLPAGIPIAAGAGDAAAGAVGIGAVQAGDGFISLGTSGQVFVTTPEYRPNPQSRIHAYAHCLPGLWFQMAAMLNGARPMAWFAEILNRPIADLLAEAETAPAGPLFLPYLTGERTPHGDSEIRGGFANLAEGVTQGSMMRAVVEAIAFTFADAMAALNSAGTVPHQLLAIGGGTRSDFLMQMIADATGCRLGRSAGADLGPALGAARLASVAAGNMTLSDAAQKPPVQDWFNPSPTPEMQKRLAAYRTLYPALREVQAQLA